MITRDECQRSDHFDLGPEILIVQVSIGVTVGLHLTIQTLPQMEEACMHMRLRKVSLKKQIFTLVYFEPSKHKHIRTSSKCTLTLFMAAISKSEITTTGSNCRLAQMTSKTRLYICSVFRGIKTYTSGKTAFDLIPWIDHNCWNSNGHTLNVPSTDQTWKRRGHIIRRKIISTKMPIRDTVATYPNF